ncbi:iron ABC transporter permease [Corynebacterium liangguodongii]|uniref:Iron ABC transporter permease n=1 Tax=Corynebacterium liangguodongii TaxID=2079535 RepID=A0A2S0WH46_9CORY|nr:iron ABC transporter permease [Corynebacterium liangguodongii]PWC00680.1 iron ABC transporter permease [Corynebacterium liangguodongii]
MRSRIPRLIVLVALAAVLAATIVVAVAIGPVRIPLAEVVASLSPLNEPVAAQEALVTAVRVPRVLVAALVGAGLGVAGAAMQAVFRNPLAEPGITGVSAGAATVAVVMIVSGVVDSAPWALPLGAFAGALAIVALVQGVGMIARSTASLLLVGVAVNAFLGAVISAVVANAVNAEDARSAMFWLNGDLTGRTMADVRMCVIPLCIGAVTVLIYARELNLLSVGESLAQTSGLNVVRVKNVVLAGAALTTAAGVAVTGAISFVGLLVPHILRLAFGGDHRFLLPASALAGAAFLVAADTAARMLFNPVTLQTGTVTALVGAPFLLGLVLTRARTT